MTELQLRQARRVKALERELRVELPLALERWRQRPKSHQIQKLESLLRIVHGRNYSSRTAKGWA